MLQCDFAQISDFPQRFEQDSSPDRLRFGREGRRVERQAFRVRDGKFPVPTICQLVQPGTVLTR